MSDVVSRLRGIAGQATPGPWRLGDYNKGVQAADGLWVSEPPIPFENVGLAGSNAEYIATFDPTTVLAMLDVIDAAEHAAGFAARGQGSTPVLTQQIVAELDAALAQFREVVE